MWKKHCRYFLIIIFYSYLFVSYQWDVLCLAAAVVESEACFPTLLSVLIQVPPPGRAAAAQVSETHQVGSVHVHSWSGLFQVLAPW